MCTQGHALMQEYFNLTLLSTGASSVQDCGANA